MWARWEELDHVVDVAAVVAGDRAFWPTETRGLPRGREGHVESEPGVAVGGPAGRGRGHECGHGRRNGGGCGRRSPGRRGSDGRRSGHRCGRSLRRAGERGGVAATGQGEREERTDGEQDAQAPQRRSPQKRVLHCVFAPFCVRWRRASTALVSLSFASLDVTGPHDVTERHVPHAPEHRHAPEHGAGDCYASDARSGRVRAIFLTAGGPCSGAPGGEPLSVPVAGSRIDEARKYNTTVRHGIMANWGDQNRAWSEPNRQDDSVSR